MPAHASSALEDAMKDALPDLFEAAPDLMYSLVTMVSPTNLQVSTTPPDPHRHQLAPMLPLTLFSAQSCCHRILDAHSTSEGLP